MATAAKPRKNAVPTPGPPKPALDVGLVRVNAALAKEWLEVNVSNRTVRNRKVIEYRRDMLGGKWKDVGDAIRFDTNGDMCDGQHRMMALVEADEEAPGLTFDFLVVRGVQPEDWGVIDTGTKRTAGDQLKMAGYKNHTLLAAAAKWCCMWDRQAVYGDKANRSVTHPEILEYVEKNPALVSIADTVSTRMRIHIDMPPGYIVASYFLCSRVSEGDAFEFFERLTDGAMLAGGDPILALRSRLRDLDRTRSNLSGDMWLSLVFRTWNARREGRPLRALPLDRQGTPIPAPELR
jgi:hypothetical protein